SQADLPESERLLERAALGMSVPPAKSRVEPFQDILSGGTVLQKQMAIAKITRYFRPSFAPLLRQASQDANAAGRVQAATALAKLEHDFTLQAMQMTKAQKASPEDRAAQIKLATLYDNYAQAGLLDEESQRSLREKAAAIYRTQLTQRDDAALRLR